MSLSYWDVAKNKYIPLTTPVTADGPIFASMLSPPVLYGVSMMTADPTTVQGGAAITPGQVFLGGAVASLGTTISAVTFNVTAHGTPTANQCFVGLYDFDPNILSPHNLLAHSAAGAADTAFGSNGWQTVSFSGGASVTLVPGNLYYLALLYNGTAGSLAAATTAINGTLQPLGYAMYGQPSGGGNFTSLPTDFTTAAVLGTNSLFFMRT
jgi:hypothetical protein